MPRLIPRYLALLAILLVAVPAAWAAGFTVVQEPLDDDPMGVTIYRLDNGLTVYLTENHETPRFYAEIIVRAGSKQDPAESTGLAHYLEHLLFKGTTRMGTLDYEQERVHLDRIADLYQQHFHEEDPEERARIYAEINEASLKAGAYAIPNEFDRLYSAMGASGVNAHTWHEETVYRVALPANRMQHWAKLESERFREPVFRLFQTELETVYEEMNRALDNKGRIIYNAVSEQLYKKHPYGQQPTLGTVDHLKNPSLKNIGDYYETYYVPNNMAIAISGSIDKDKTIAIIAEYFAYMEPGELPELEGWVEAPLEGRETVETTYRGEEYVLLAFRTVDQNHEDAEALQLLDMVLDNSTAGLINLNLNQQQRVRRAGASPAQHNDYGAQMLWGIPKDSQTPEEVEQLLLEQVEILKRGEFEDWLIPAIINDYKKTEKTALESNLSRVAALRNSVVAGQDWAHTVRRIQRMEQLTKEDVVRVANTYFGEDYVAGFRRDAPHHVPDIEKPPLAAVEIDSDRQSEFAAALLALPVEPIEPEFVTPGVDYQYTALESGVDWYHVPNPINDVFSFSIIVEKGTHQDPALSAAAALLRKSGTQDFDTEELQKEWYKLGTDFSIGVGDNETTLSLRGLDEYFAPSIKLLMDLMHTPTAEEDALEQLINIVLAEREDAKKQMDGIATALVQYNRLGEDSAYLRMLPAAELRALTVEDLHARTQGLLGYKHTVSYAGSLPKDQVMTAVQEHLTGDNPLKDPPPYHYRKARAPEQTEIFFFPHEAAQASVRIEFGTQDLNPELEPAIQLYNEYFAGGMSGIVFQELREARALAYSAGARYITGYKLNDQDLMVGAIGCQADKTSEALEAFVELFDNLAVSESRFQMAQESIINSYRTGKIGFRGVSGAVRSWKRHGLEPDPRRDWFEAIQESDIETILAFHREHITGRPKLVSIVGDPARINLETLEAAGPVRTVELEDIFVD